MGKGSAKVEEAGSGSESEDEGTGPPPNLLEVKVIEAEDVIAADRGGTSDPYAVVEFRGIQKKTKVIKKSLTPKWNETFQFEIGKPAGILTIDLFDHDVSLFGKHDFLGQAQVNLSSLTLEAVFQEWLQLQPREGKLEIVSGRLHLYVCIVPKDKSVEDKTGLDSFPWLDRSLYTAKGHVRTTNVIKMYFASTYADFQDEFKELHSTVFPKLETLCQTQGYSFVPVVMRLGLDERLDLLYMNDTRICPMIFREIAECRRISPRANFFAFLGERYGAQFLPASLDKNEYMAICGSLMEDDDDDMAILALLQTWYKLDENQTPSRLLLQPSVGDVSASAGLGTDQHNEWLRVEKQLFDALKSITAKVLGANRLWKYKVSLFEQEVTLGALLPEDAADHVTCVLRTISNLRVVNVNAAKFVDIIGRRGDSITDKDLKEVRPNMIDEDKRSMNKDLKMRVTGKLGARCCHIMSQWQGWTNGSDHIPELCDLVYEKLMAVFVAEMTKYPRHGFLREEVLLHRRAQIASQKVLKKDSKTNDLPRGEFTALDGIRDYLNANSDNTLTPLLVRGAPGSGMTAMLSLATSWCKEKMLPGAVTVHRQCGLTPDSTNGCMLLWSLVKQLTISYTAGKKVKLQMDLTIKEARDLPAADPAGFFDRKGGPSSDPFVQVKVAKHKIRTKTIKKNLNPEWNEHYDLKDLVLTDKMLVSVWDYDVIGKNDILGQVEIPLAKIELNTPFEKWYALPMELAEEKPPPVVIFFDAKVIAAKDLQPQSFRMDVDPFVRLTLGSASVQTTHRDDTQDPDYNEDFELTLEDEADQMLKFSVWDKGDGNSYEDGLLGEGEFSLAEIDVEATYEGWVQLKLGGREAGSVHFMITKHSETLEVEEEEVTEGPRVLLQMTLTPMPTNIDKALDRTPLDIPCMYLPLAERFRETLLLASASKPINIILDGFDSIPSSDPTTTMRWLPEKLPRYVHVVLGFRDVECKALDVMLNRDTRPRTVKLKLQDPEFCRENLTASLTARKPKRTLANAQRGSLLASFSSKTLASGPGEVLAVASCIPSYDSPIAIDKREVALKEIIRARSSYVLNGKVDAFRLWQAMDHIAMAPMGITEAELKEHIGGGTLGPMPSICFAEIMTVLEPLIRERHVDGCLVIQFKYDAYADVVKSQRFSNPGESAQICQEMLSRMQKLPDFDHGGRIDGRRLRCIPLLLKSLGDEGMYQLDEYLTDMHILEMRLCSNMVFDVLLNLIEHGPGIGGKAGDLLGLMEEYAVLLHNRPRMLLQIALNMPDHTGVYVQGRYLEMRRRRSHFFAQDQLNPPQNMSMEEKLKRRQSQRLASMGDRDLVLGHADSIKWREARSWVKWLNKPQTRGQCKKVLKGHAAATQGASYICNGLVLLSVSADRTIKAFSPFTGEVLKEIGQHPKGVTIMELSPDMKWMATGSEDGTVIVWELDAGPPPTAGTAEKMQDAKNGEVGGHRKKRNGSGQERDKDDAAEEEAHEGREEEGSNNTAAVRYPAEKLRIKMFSKRITGLAFTPGETIAIAADETDVKILEIHGDGQTELNSFVPYRYNVAALAATSPDAQTQMLAVAGRNAVKIYRYETLDFRGGLYGHERSVTDVRFCRKSHDELMLATVSNDTTLKVWQQSGPREWQIICDLGGHSDCIRSVAWSPDDQSILTGSVDHTIKVWTLHADLEGEDGNEEGNIRGEARKEREDSREAKLKARIAKRSQGTAASVTRAAKHKKFGLLATFDGHGDTVTNVRFHPQGTLAISSSRDKEVRVYDTRVPFRAVEPATHSTPVKIVTAAKSQDHRGRELVASADTAGIIKIWDVSTGEPLLVFSVDSEHTMPLTAVAFTNSVKYMITASKDGSLKRWDLHKLAQDREEEKLSDAARQRLEEKKKKEKRDGHVEENPLRLKAHKGGVAVLRMHHQGEFFLTSGMQEAKITIWDAETMLDVQAFDTPSDCTTLHATFSNDGKFVISADSSNKFRLWNIEGNKEVFNSVLDTTDVMESVDFSSDGKYIATVAIEAADITIWDASAGLKIQGMLKGHSGTVVATSFAHDGRHMCSVAQDNTLLVWLLKDCQSIASLLLDHVPSSVFIGRSWPRLVAGDSTGHVYLLEVISPVPLDLDEETAITQTRLASPPKSRGASLH